MYPLVPYAPLLLLPLISAQSSSPLQKYTIAAPGINATFIPYGARLTNLFVNDKNGNPQDVVLGYDDPAQYINDTNTVHTYYGPIVGRYANRIKNGTFTIDGRTSHIPTNEHNGSDTLHGGTTGYDQRNWTVVSSNASSITFSLLDPGYEGFPGTIITYATYTVSSSTSSSGPSWTSRLVSIPLDEPTPIMLANHIYWNLGAFVSAAGSTVLNDTLHMPYSARYIPFDGIEVPTGALAAVQGTYLDFTSPKPIGRDIAQAVDGCGTGCTGYDNAFILDRPRGAGPEAMDVGVLGLESGATGIRMDVFTNQQSLQVYTCDNLDGTIPVKGSQRRGAGGAAYVPQYGCIVIETQQWIDGINHPEWGQEQYQIYSVETGPAVVWARYDFSVV
ncbi:aldose 1-epimerase [Physcia stellaris]|nr:aldose 1-epimerase [Physcia stellaris]